MQLEARWVDEKNHDLGKTPTCFCGKRFLQERWQLKTEHPSGYEVSTVHLELAHQSNMDLSSDETMWYETMIVDKEGKFLEFQARYHDKKEATQGHELTLKLLPKIIENPEKYPSDIISTFLKKSQLG